MDRALLLIVGQAIDAIMGEPDGLWRRVPHPVVLIGKVIEKLDTSWNRAGESPTTRKAWGAAALAATLALAAAVGALIQGVALKLPFGELVIALVVAIMLAQRSLHDHVTAVADGLAHGGLEGGRAAVAKIVGRAPDILDEAAVGRAAIESAAENLSDGVVAPALWFLIGGLPGLLAYKALNTADSMIGHKTDRHRDFGWAAARLDDLANWPAARLTTLLVLPAAWSLKLDWRGAWKTALADADKHNSVNAGWPEAAFAGALGLRLAGPRQYGADRVDAPWMGSGRAEVDVPDIRRAISLMTRCCLALALLSGVLAIGW